MELCQINLHDYLNCIEKINQDKITNIRWTLSSHLFKELVECVNYLHTFERGPIIHRDIKPSNILWKQNDHDKRVLKLCDFGLSKFIDSSIHTTRTGTAKYMAPEVLNSCKYNIKADIYSTAIVTMELFGLDINQDIITPETW